jgi:hypothetical protein
MKAIIDGLENGRPDEEAERQLDGERFLEIGCSLGLQSSCVDFAADSPIGPERMKEACARGLTQACLPEK